MERKALLSEAKKRKKSFLKAMPDDQRRLLLMHQRLKRRSKVLLYAIPVTIVVFLILYCAAGFYFQYENRWMINGIIFASASLIMTGILLCMRSVSLKQMKAFSAPIADFVSEYTRICDRVRELKKTEKT